MSLNITLWLLEDAGNGRKGDAVERFNDFRSSELLRKLSISEINDYCQNSCTSSQNLR